MSKLLVDEISDADNTGPVTVTDGLIGDVTGTLTGNVTGNLTGNVTGNINGLTPQASNMQPFNRIINGAMTIDQRNAGASVTLSSGSIYTLDRFTIVGSQVSKLSCQQNAGSVTLPSGFINYLGLTSLSAYSITSTDYFTLQQTVEGFNVADLGWGTANAATVTLSFQVYSSLTGTFGGSLYNNNADRSYPFSYSIPVANTWVTISITIAGDTTGTWLTTNGAGVRINWGLGVGSTISGTAGAWAGAHYRSATGATSIVGTSGATFYITGVQLEVGSSASSFAHENYGDTLQKCQRYYFQKAIGSGNSSVATGNYYTSTILTAVISFPVTMRVSPTIYQVTGTNYYAFIANGGADGFNSLTRDAIGQNQVTVYNNTEAAGTAGHGGNVILQNGNASLAFGAEL
jgi:hypothetical protein